MLRPIPQLEAPPPRPRSIIPALAGVSANRLVQLRVKRADLKWDDFDHSLDLYLGFKKLVRIVYPRETYHPIALRSCDLDKYTAERLGLINITEGHHSFIPTMCVFPYQKKMNIGLELLDISLFDLISNTVRLSEIHVKAILYNVGLQLLYRTFNC
jgi:hypothetical protein